MKSWSLMKNIDVNFEKDITLEDPKARCFWYTILAGISEHVDETTGDIKYKYEYVLFPETLRDEKDMVVISTENVYYNTIRHML